MGKRLGLISLLSGMLIPCAHASDPLFPQSDSGSSSNSGGSAPAPHLNSADAQKVNIETLKRKYWNSGKADLSVVQNRIYTKSGRLSISASGSLVSHDPFLSTQALGLTGGYHLSEYFGIHLHYWKFFEQNSNAVASLQQAEQKAGTALYGANVNKLSSMLGAEVSWSVLYGKLSLLGKAIIHFDLALLGGVGSLSAANGTSIMPWIGIGNQLYLNKSVALQFNYRYGVYSETLVEMNNVATLGQTIGTRSSSSNIVSLGVAFFIN